IKTPLKYVKETLVLERSITDRIGMIDNFIELIVFTPCGSFMADEEFGFEYWNHEYSNVHFMGFNNGQNETYVNGQYREVTLRECKESIEKSLHMYEPQLKQIGVFIELNTVSKDEQMKKVRSRYEVNIRVTGQLEDGLGTYVPYKKEISFLMEPMVKRVKI
ncbi:MAG: hypothetical protein LUD48_04795, partial [Prevotella sp.]|nr:hypothetical protein [Prevotella sp.]